MFMIKIQLYLLFYFLKKITGVSLSLSSYFFVFCFYKYISLQGSSFDAVDVHLELMERFSSPFLLDIDFHLTMNSSAACAATSPPAPSPVASAHNQISDLPSPQSSHKQSLSGQIPPSQKKSASEPEATSPAAGSSLSLVTSVIPLLKLTTDDSNLNLHQSSTDIASALSSGSSTLTGSSLPEKLNMLDDSGQSDRPIQGEGFISNPLECSNTAKATNPSLDFQPGNALKTSRSRSVPPAPVSKSFHSDVYNTAFALQSLGDGNWSDYLTKVRAMWDDQFLTKQPSASMDSNNLGGVSGGVTRRNGSNSAGQNFTTRNPSKNKKKN